MQVCCKSQKTKNDDTHILTHSEIFAPDLNIYPNPFTDEVRITGIGEIEEKGKKGKIGETVQLQVINSAGIVVYTQKITNPDETIRLEQLPSGVYFFTIESDGQSKTVKIVKE